MPKALKAFLLVLILLTAGCRFAQPEPTPLSTSTNLPETVPTSTLPPQATATDEPSPTVTPQPEPTVVEATQPPPPTPKLSELLLGEPIPLLPATRNLNLQSIQMITSQAGWGLTRVEGEGDHLLITETGGRSWQDVTPPQPLSDSGQDLEITVGYADDQTAFVHYTGTKLVWTTYNGGTTWQPSALSYQSMMGGMFAVADSDHAWLFQFLDGGMQKVYTALSRTTNGGKTWEIVLDPYSESLIQGFDKTGSEFLNPQYGWLTRDFRGVAAYLYLDITQDGGVTWEQLEMPAPPTDEDAFSTCACGLYDPVVDSPQRGSVRMTCRCFEGETTLIKNYFYKTKDGGSSWNITYVPEGTLHTISDQIRYLTADDIYRSTDGGQEWELVKTVNWQGQFSFVSSELAFAIAYDPEDEEYALVKSIDGCGNFQIIEPVLEPNSAVR